MSIYVLQGREQRGPFTLAQVNSRLSAGSLKLTDLAWQEGAGQWLPLADLLRDSVISVDPSGPDSPAGIDAEPPQAVESDASSLPTAAEASEGTTPPASDHWDRPEEEADVQQLFFRRAAKALRDASEHLMCPFDETNHGLQQKVPIDTAAFFRLFLAHAEQFNHDCSVAFAGVLRHSTRLESVRGTTVKQLAKEIRAEAFEQCDLALAHYHQTVACLTGDLDATLEQVDALGGQPSLLGGALVGSLLGGKGARGRGALAGGLAAGANAWSALNQQAALLGQAQTLVAQAELLAPEQVGEYLDAVRAMPEALIDFLGARCFGPAVDLQVQRRCVQVCVEYIDALNAKALTAIRAMYQQNEALAEAAQGEHRLPKISFRLGCLGTGGNIIATGGFIGACLARDAENALWSLFVIPFGLGFVFYQHVRIDRLNQARGYE